MQGQGLMQGCRRTFHLQGGTGAGIDLFVCLFAWFGPLKGKKKWFHNQQHDGKENPSNPSL